MIWTNENGETYEFDMDHLESECEQIASNLMDKEFDIDYLMQYVDNDEVPDDFYEEYNKLTKCFELGLGGHHDDTLPLHEQGESIVDDTIKRYLREFGADERLSKMVDLVARECI